MGSERTIVSLVMLALFTGCASAPVPLTAEETRLRRQAATDQINASLKTQHQLFDDCSARYSEPWPIGTLIVRFQVQTNGSTRRPHIFENIGQSSELDHCLSEATLKLKFAPLPAGVVADVNYPIHFKPGTRSISSSKSH